ncbi:EAL domain-containing protein [Ochrobactrum pseudogrignonense]|nr:EAL domain-containing protein [Brucella pseudogrignonensis]
MSRCCRRLRKRSSHTRQLLRLEVDIVKIDAAFVRDIKESHPRGNSLQFMIGLAKCAAPTVIVEGVETNTHLIDAVMAGATHAQGYHLSRPVFLHSNEPVFRLILRVRHVINFQRSGACTGVNRHCTGSNRRSCES